MDSKELRIGNWVKRKTQPEGFQIDAQSFSRIDKPNHDYQPIPLTEEWLIKFTHKNINTSGMYQKDRFILRWMGSYNYWYVVDAESGTYITKVEFVHEWQNAYRFLNGEELTIKE